MWKLDFFLLPSNSYNDIKEDDARKFEENVKYLKEHEEIYIPNEFYEIGDINHLTAGEFLFENSQNDITDFLLEIISKQKVCSDTYEEIKQKAEYGYLAMIESDVTEDIAHICIKNIKDVEEEKYLSVNDVVKTKRFYIKKVEDYELYEERAKACFPNIIFHDDAFKYVERLGKCTDVVEELTRHLIVLNDVGKKLYDYHNKNEKATLSELKSGYNIVCSGKGSKEEESYNKEIVYNCNKYQLTCNPHTKLYKKKTDQRIYFCWGRDEIENHSIIIVRIGNHWKE